MANPKNRSLETKIENWKRKVNELEQMQEGGGILIATRDVAGIDQAKLKEIAKELGIEEIKVEYALNRQRIETLSQELEKINERKDELERSKEELRSKIKILNNIKKHRLLSLGFRGRIKA